MSRRKPPRTPGGFARQLVVQQARAAAARSRVALQRPALWRRYWADYRFFHAQIRGTEPIGVDPFPQLADSVAKTPFDPHYVQQGPWVFRRLLAHRPAHHVDVGSFLGYLGFFGAITPTTFLDIRPASLGLPGVREEPGDVTALPFETGSVESLSCLHVVEHVGLGRYGDPVDVSGSRKAVQELARVLAPDGHLYLSMPVGNPRIMFNAHRIHHPDAPLQMASDLTLLERDVVLDDGRVVAGCPTETAVRQSYACGLYHFTK